MRRKVRPPSAVIRVTSRLHVLVPPPSAVIRVDISSIGPIHVQVLGRNVTRLRAFSVLDYNHGPNQAHRSPTSRRTRHAIFNWTEVVQSGHPVVCGYFHPWSEGLDGDASPWGERVSLHTYLPPSS